MAGITFEKGSIIYEYGDPMTALHLIASGKITASYPGGTYQLEKGDVIGVCEICSEVHFLNYTAAEDVKILTYNFTNIAVLDDLLKKHPDVARLFILSACNQINILLERCSISELDCSDFYQNASADYEKYYQLCNRYRIAVRTPNNWNELNAYLGDEAPDLWLSEYYLGLSHMYSSEHSKHLVQISAVSVGLLRKCSLDFRRAYTVLEEQFRYLQQIAGYYFNPTGNDLFDSYTSLYYKIGQDCSDTASLLIDIKRMITKYRDSSGMDSAQLNHRISSFETNIARLQTPLTDPKNCEDNTVIPEELVDSLNTILEFVGCDLELTSSFREHVHTYKQLGDKFATDENSCHLRATLTKEYYALYALLFERTMETVFVPAPVRMFLYFGYVDEELAGITNAVYLYNLLDTMTDHSAEGIYTFYDWLIAIFQGRKEPSRNEFDQDYNDYIHKQKINGTISETELRTLEGDNMAKVNYELRNMFPTVNKITYGRISIYCPLFCADNVLKSLEDSYVSISKLAKALENIRKIDYSAFYRESLDKEHLDILGKEMLHFEYLPDFVLMPNVGIRGSMWQEIEGKRRNSSCRMMFSLFHLEDINITMIRLTGEFRWELCKRIQGGRWNDISEPSLTSEYFDYIQFYRKNNDLTAEGKEKIRSSLQRAKNSFKEMFVRDYITWIMYEGNGSPRLNKVSRKILFTYCPFSADIRENLKQNPIYTEILSHFDLKTAQKLHRLNTLIKKLRNGGILVPDSLEKELQFIEGTSTSNHE